MSLTSSSSGSLCDEYADLAPRQLSIGSEDNLALIAPEGRNWNEEFQTLLDLSFENEDEEMHRMAQLRQLSHEFATRATEIGQTIITEKDIDTKQKTIKPHTQRVGGYAGGEKYVVDGIFFKFAVDNHGLYGDDEQAMKCGVHEFKSFMELTDCRVQGLHFPLIVIIDYRGFRLLCQSVLPIGADTLIYGSSDGGKNIYASDHEMNKRMKRVAKLLNLAGHDVFNTSKTKQVRLHGPVDCEGHLGMDGRFYIIDPARLFPPAKPNPTIKSSKLFRLLRPELVMKSRLPLCSDSFSNFNVLDRSTLDSHTEEIDHYLHYVLVPEFTQYLCHDYHNKYNDNPSSSHFLQNSTNPSNNPAYLTLGLSSSPNASSLFTILSTQHLDITDLERIVNEAHRKGINLRYLGQVRHLVPPYNHLESSDSIASKISPMDSKIVKMDSGAKSDAARPHKRQTSQDEDPMTKPPVGSPGLDLLRRVLLTIIVGRVLKNLIRSHLRTIHTPDERPYRKLLLTYLNLLLGRTPKALEFWSKPIKSYLETSFPSALTPSEISPSYNLRLSILPYTLYLYVQDLLGLEMRLESKAKFSNIVDPDTPLPSSSSSEYIVPPQYLLFKPFVDTDLLNVVPKVRYTNRMSFEEGTALSRKAKFAGSQEASDKYFLLAEKNYRAALRIKPDDYRALHNWGLSLTLQAQTKSGMESMQLYEIAQSKWKQALDINPQDYRAYLLWGNMLLERAETIPTALPHHMDDLTWTASRSKLNRARENEKLKLLEQACNKYQQAYDLNEDQYETLYNWATSLLIRATLERDNAMQWLQEAANKYQGATALKPNSLKSHLNWAVALAKAARHTFDTAFPLPVSQHRSTRRAPRRSMEIPSKEIISTKPSHDSSTSGSSKNDSSTTTGSKSDSKTESKTSSSNTFGSSVDSKVESINPAPVPSASSKYFKKAEKLFKIATEKFEECLELRPDDCEVYFNYGNALYRRARVHERCKSYLSAFELCSLCCERYISAINIKLNYYDALYNWGSVVYFQTTLSNLESKNTEILFSVNCYLEVFKKVALRYGGTERFKLDPVLSLLHSKTESIQRRAIHAINFLCIEGKDAVQREAARAIKSLLASPSSRRMLNEELEEGDWSKFASRIVRSIGTADKLIDDEDETGKTITLAAFQAGAAIDGGDAGVGKMMRTLKKSTQQPYIMVLVAHNELLDRLGILEKEESLISLNQQQAFALRKSFINHLKTEKNFLAQLQYSFQTEEDDYCLLYKYDYNPGMLWEFLCNPASPSKVREQHIRFYAAELLIALQSLHGREMMYGDLNPLELLVDHQGHILLHKIPFSQQAAIKPSDLSPEYVAPEVLTSQQPYKAATDWYCYGVLLYQLATCVVQSFSSTPPSASLTANVLPPSKASKSKSHSRATSSDKSNTSANLESRLIDIPALGWVDDGHGVNFSGLDGISADLKNLISQLLDMDARSRLKSASKIQKHPFWGNLNWKMIETAGMEPPFRPGLGTPSSHQQLHRSSYSLS